MDGQALVTDMDKQIHLLDTAINAISKYGRVMAEKEKAYRILYAKELLKAKEEDKTPMSIIESVVKGKEEVAQAKLEWAISETLYQNNLEFINGAKKKIEVINGEIARGWQRSKE
jgi:hypothetical protein